LWLWRVAMIYHRLIHGAVCKRLLVVILLSGLSTAQADIDINEAIRLALADDPVIAASQARAQAFSDNAVADGQLPDPKLRTGIYNLPLDTFEFDREPTTQFRLGLVQEFPRGNTLELRQKKSEWMANAEVARTEAAQRMLVRDVRRSFLELYYQLQAEQVINETRDLFAQLVDITQAHYATGRVSQQDVLRASLELSRLDDRTTRILNEADKSRAALTKWIGEAASLPVASGFPELPALPAKTAIETSLPQHPVIRTETAKIEASNQRIRIAREQFKPGWSAGLEYRKRFGDDPNGDDRADMMAAMVTVELPWFTESRQDKRLSASIEQTKSVQLERDDKLRELLQMLNTDYANWQRLGERVALYESQLLHESTANARASLNAYQSGVTEFTTLMRARITDLDVRLDDLRVRVDRARAQANLLYLAGEGK
ncbi:MAG: TolC family protein, partial [Pseudomonadota bacterium]|nr:TolC family protein [Pseudomonadota bacterium]